MFRCDGNNCFHPSWIPSGYSRCRIALQCCTAQRTLRKDHLLFWAFTQIVRPNTRFLSLSLSFSVCYKYGNIPFFICIYLCDDECWNDENDSNNTTEKNVLKALVRGKNYLFRSSKKRIKKAKSCKCVDDKSRFFLPRKHIIHLHMMWMACNNNNCSLRELLITVI